jgi:hypothetical protein
MSSTNFSSLLVPAAPARGTWRGRLAGWLAATRRQRPDDVLPEGLGSHLSRDMGLSPAPSHEDRVCGAAGLMWR